MEKVDRPGLNPTNVNSGVNFVVGTGGGAMILFWHSYCAPEGYLGGGLPPLEAERFCTFETGFT